MRRFIFGFDAGTASGAWSVIDTEEMKILGTGLFPATPVDKISFGKAQKFYWEENGHDLDVVLEDVIPVGCTMTANMALKGSVMFMEGLFYGISDKVNINYIDPAISSKHPLGCWLKEFGLLNLEIDTTGLCRKDISKARKEAINNRTIEIVREIFPNADEFLSKPSKEKKPTKTKKVTIPKIKKPDPNIATSILIAEFWRRKRNV